MNAIVNQVSPPSASLSSGNTVGPSLADHSERDLSGAAGELRGFCEQERVIRGGKVVACNADATYHDEFELFLCKWCYREMAA